MKNLILFLFSLSVYSIYGQKQEAGILLVDPSRTEDVFTTAIRNYTHIIDAEPENVKALLQRSNLYTSLNKRMEASMDRALALSINEYATLFVNQGARNNIIDKRKYSFKTNYETFGKSFLLESEYNQEISKITANPDLRTNLKLALKHIKNKDFGMATTALDQISDTVDNPLYHDLRGVIELKNQNYGTAIKHFDNALAVDSSFTITFYNRAVAYKFLGYLDEAERDFKTALIQRSDIAKIHFGKANLYELKGDTKNAQYYYNSAANVNEDYNEASLNHAVILKSKGEYTDALIQVTKLIDKSPEISENYYVRGGIYFIRGEFSNAVDDFDKFLAYNEDDLTVQFYKGLALHLGGSAADGCYEMQSSIDDGYENTKNTEIYIHMCK